MRGKTFLRCINKAFQQSTNHRTNIRFIIKRRVNWGRRGGGFWNVVWDDKSFCRVPCSRRAFGAVGAPRPAQRRPRSKRGSSSETPPFPPLPKSRDRSFPSLLKGTKQTRPRLDYVRKCHTFLWLIPFFPWALWPNDVVFYCFCPPENVSLKSLVKSDAHAAGWRPWKIKSKTETTSVQTGKVVEKKIR